MPSSIGLCFGMWWTWSWNLLPCLLWQGLWTKGLRLWTYTNFVLQWRIGASTVSCFIPYFFLIWILNWITFLTIVVKATLCEERSPKRVDVHDVVSQYMQPNKWSARVKFGISVASTAATATNPWTPQISVMAPTVTFTAEVATDVTLVPRVSDLAWALVH